MKNEEWMITQLDDGGGKNKDVSTEEYHKRKTIGQSFEKHKEVATIDVKKRC